MSRSRSLDRGGLTIADQSAHRKRKLAVVYREPLFFHPLDWLVRFSYCSSWVFFNLFILHILLLRYLMISYSWNIVSLYASERSQLQNSFTWIEDYNGYNPITKERESLDWFSSLFKVGFFTWRWRVSLVPRWPAERQVSLENPLFGSTGEVAQLLSVMESQRDL